MNSYLFSLGNSNDGPVGFCMSVRAESREQALQKLKDALPTFEEIPTGNPAVEYFVAYFNPDAVTISDIEDEEPVMTDSDKGLTPDQLAEKYNPHGDGEHPRHPRESWFDAVLHGYTLRGYWDWVANAIEDEDDEGML